MAVAPYVIIAPTSMLAALLYFRTRIPRGLKPVGDWQEASVEVILPARNEANNILFALSSLARQTLLPDKVRLFDDASTDDTVAVAEKFAEQCPFPLEVVRRSQGEGKTAALRDTLRVSDADVLFVLDSDTILESDDYIQRCVEKMYSDERIGSVCGFVKPILRDDYQKMVDFWPGLKEYRERILRDDPEKLMGQTGYLQRAEQRWVNEYRATLYHFLQKFIFRAQCKALDTLVNPVGCAVAYRKKYLAFVFERYMPKFDINFTTSEDIFIGFALVNQGCHNVQLLDIETKTQEPHLNGLFKQIRKWSASYLQNSYYFDGLIRTPIKFLKKLMPQMRIKEKDIRVENEVSLKLLNEELYTQQYGRPVGWLMFSLAFEKVSFPTLFIIFGIHQLPQLLILVFIEVLFFSSINAIVAKRGERVWYFAKSILVTPLRYAVLLYDLVIITKFTVDLWITHNRNWRK